MHVAIIAALDLSEQCWPQTQPALIHWSTSQRESLVEVDMYTHFNQVGSTCEIIDKIAPAEEIKLQNWEACPPSQIACTVYIYIHATLLNVSGRLSPCVCVLCVIYCLSKVSVFCLRLPNWVEGDALPVKMNSMFSPTMVATKNSYGCTWLYSSALPLLHWDKQLP